MARRQPNPACADRRSDRPDGRRAPVRRRAYTLTELLVTIGLIALLVAILLPALSAARRAAQHTQCASNLRAIGQLLGGYAAAHHGAFPPKGPVQVFGGDGVAPDRPGLGWTELIAPDSPRPGEYLRCPTIDDDSVALSYFLSARWTTLHKRSVLRQSDIREASQFILAAECTRRASYPPPFGVADLTLDDCDKDDGMVRSLHFPPDPLGMTFHRAGSNVLFADGHVASAATFDRAAMTYHPGRPGQDWREIEP